MRVLAAIATLIAGLAGLLAAATEARAAAITGVSIERQGKAVELRFAVQGRGLGWTLSIHQQQIWIDLSNARIDLGARPLEGRELAPVTAVRVIYAGGVRGRVVIEVAGRTDYVIGQLRRELVLRLAPAGAAPHLAAPLLTRMDRRRNRQASGNSAEARPAGARPPGGGAAQPAGSGRFEAAQPRRDQIPEPPPQLASRAAPERSGPSGRPLVVIDAGHGGRDPGTEAAGAVAEKEIALQIAIRLRAALAENGIAARLTRADDTFLRLAERTQLANRDHADLFVSIHLNSSPDANTAGIETYYLNNTTDRATIRLAQMENGVAGGYGAPGEPNLNYILTDLRQQDKANESASLARMIEAETAAYIGASMGLRVNELGAKQGPFYVLVGALMPSVLVECGFLSNPGEARLLELPQYQQGLAEGIARAVEHYFNADAAVGNL